MLLLHSLFKLVRRNQHAGTISRRRLKTVNRQVFIDFRTVVVNDPLRALERAAVRHCVDTIIRDVNNLVLP